MELGNQILFFLAGLGVFNGFLLALYFLFFARPEKWANILFGLLMLMLCLRIGKSLFLIFADVPRVYKQIGLSACMMIGPFLLLYLRNLLSKHKRPGKTDVLYALLPLASIMIVGIIRPYEGYPVLWNTVIVQVIYIVWIAYMIASLILVWPLYRKVMKQSASILEQWMVLLNSSILILCIAFNLALHGFPYLAGPLLFSLVLYVLMAFLAAKRNRSVVLLEETVKYQNQKIEAQEAELILRRLAEQMQLSRPYLQQNIKLAEVAASIDSTPHELSQVINDRLGISFNQYINEYRVKAACNMLSENDHLTVEGIGQEVGFKSRSAFYTAFKTYMGETPGQYKAKLKSTGV